MCNFEDCKKGLHPFKVVSRFTWDDESKVVRWCPECGAIVVDMDYDGRTNPGYYKKLQYPNITYKYGFEEHDNYLELKRKNTPMKKKKHGYNKRCPICNYVVDNAVPTQNYCDRCGQRLKD